MTETTKVNLWVGGTIDVPSDHPMFQSNEELKAMIKLTPFPPDRVCPECGDPVGRHDGMLYCKRECSLNELARYDLEHEADEC